MTFLALDEIRATGRRLDNVALRTPLLACSHCPFRTKPEGQHVPAPEMYRVGRPWTLRT
ncbi:hypothetical protein H4687_000110 [Streptomyces stelliscabiei]|uniref:Uncharacterized protein n=1 Tax=Streptomyces stelliscabiei TaxID=146820 RepID=A0A8I0NUV0_9ACTN|nr:hypothetical protein [Streptomyces stelliscabiei]